ncbi:uncharacterized protein SOCE836_087060 [Sorangium cellulosum]|uniref:Uncharacterized protein n=1 Tax=Sorangium cellulosum TaxID=56 RepID=A0A4P2R1G9_SORCE|nr:uncharacterized protein SOCE836_087060 [Sorangium cellulosum]WCQ95796.1 hypothetical protein NQZ70_08573 [Sorangium sp. Soce836]
MSREPGDPDLVPGTPAGRRAPGRGIRRATFLVPQPSQVS